MKSEWDRAQEVEIRELRLRYSVEGMERVIRYIDGMKLGDLPDYMAFFLAHASNAANWHECEEN